MPNINIDSWYGDTEYITHNRHKICVKYTAKSTKPVLLLLHGFPTSSIDWYLIWDTLTPHFGIIAFDFLGFGYSDKPCPHHYSIREQADITVTVCKHFCINECFILAHDYGDSIGQELIARSIEPVGLPFEIKRILFLNGGLFSETHFARPIQKILLGPLGRIVGNMLGKKSLAKNLTQIFGKDTPPSASEIDAFWQLINHNNGKRVFYLLIRYILDRRQDRDRWVTAMQTSMIPMRLVNGPVDPVSGIHLVKRFIQLIPDADTVVLDGIGHYPQIEAPQAVAEQVIDFFT